MRLKNERCLGPEAEWLILVREPAKSSIGSAVTIRCSARAVGAPPVRCWQSQKRRNCC